MGFTSKLLSVTPRVTRCRGEVINLDLNAFRYIVQNEGPKALFKGLGPNIVGVAPSRAIYFCTYSQAKAILNQNIPPDTPIVHLSAASAAGNTPSDDIYLLSFQ